MRQSKLGSTSPVAKERVPGSKLDAFPITRWSLVVEAGQPDGGVAMSELCGRYWDPVYAYLRSLGIAPEDAREHTQGFFASLLERNSIAKIDPQAKGQFRSWLRTAAKNYFGHEWRKAHTESRGGGLEHVSAHGEDGHQLKAEQLDADEQFHRAWARTIVERAFRALRAEYAETEQSALVGQLLEEKGADRTDIDLAGELGVAKNALRVRRFRLKNELKRSFARYLRLEIADTVLRPADIDAEYEALMDLLP